MPVAVSVRMPRGGGEVTTSTIRMWHCDIPTCEATAPEKAGGWTDATYTHGCPDHGEVIAAHRATVTSRTIGRGAREKDYWYLACACDWRPRPNGIAYNSGPLKVAHLEHVRGAGGQG